MFLLLITIALSLPVVQTKIAHYATKNINEEYGTNINIDEVAITFFGGVKLKKVLILDHHQDTLIYSQRIKTSILDLNKLINGKLIFGDLQLDQFYLQIKTYKNEKDTSLDLFVDAFDDGKKGSGKFLMTSDNIHLKESRFVMIDENRAQPKDVDFTQLNAHLKKFKIKGPNVYTTIATMSFKDHRGVLVDNLEADFTYTKSNIVLQKMAIKTPESFLKGNVRLIYNKDNHDFSDFNNRVKFDVVVDSSRLSTNDIRCFYAELGKNKKFYLKSKIKGTLNNFYATRLYLVDDSNSVIRGDVNFKNLFPRSPGQFYMKGDFDKITSTYTDLTKLLPNILGKKLPSSLQKLGQFQYTGTAEVTQTYINTDFVMNTALGIVESDLHMSNLNNIDNAQYSGNVILDGFDVGALINDKTIGKVSLDLDVDGKGFTQKYLNTSFVGDVYQAQYNGYNYSKIIVDGYFKQPIFRGKVFVNDPNLFMDFNGTVDLSKRENIYDFHSKIDYANLVKLNFIKDSISVFKGDIVVKATGNSFDNLKGNLLLTNASYQNKKDIYFLDILELNSSFDATGERTIAVNSPDAIQGSVVGRFKFNQLQKMVENSLGTFYSNYKPNAVGPNQYVKFNFAVNSKIIEIFNPDITLASNTILRGNVGSDTKNFNLNFSSPKVTAYQNTFDNVLVQVDNKNPLYNAYVQMDSIKTKHYKVRDFSMINTFVNDTLHFRTEFKGGKEGLDFYNLNFYHTINKENNNVVGFEKSELMFKDYLWYLNEKDEANTNKIVFDKKMTSFSFNSLMLSHEDESINLIGVIKDRLNKDLQLDFTNVNLNKVTPDVEKFKFAGNLNGKVNFKQSNAVFQPTAQVTIDSLSVNSIALGDLNLDIKGDETLTKFHLNSNLENENVDSFNADGDIQVVGNQTLLDIDLSFDRFNLGILSMIGGDVITNIRGFASGNARIDGNFNSLDYNGRLFINDAGLTIPYLNADYQFVNNSIVDVTENKFIIRETTIKDTEFETQGTLSGYIRHKQFGDWQLDLAVNSNRLLALNTVDHEDAAYYGKAFMDGSATIKGPTSGLMIRVNAESAKGTDIKIPINDAESVEENSYIHILSPSERIKKGKDKLAVNKNFNGLELDFNFEINKNADIEVILNRDSGHGMKGKGYGTLLFRINTLGKFEMFGDFIALEGSYNFKYGGLIDKKFDVKKGGSIIWSGDPMAATLNLEAVYNTTANPAVLIDNPSFNKKVDVEVVIGVKGSLSSPEPDFNINFPTVGSTLKSEIQYQLDDKDKRQTQALYLLSTGSFLSQEGVDQNQLSNNLFEKAGSLFKDIFSGDNDKVSIAPEYVIADRLQTGQQSDARVNVNVSSRINDRITVNGKVGVPVGGITETAIVGDVEVQYRVNEDGTLNLRVFNKENDITYIGQGIGYTQGIGMSYEVDFDTLKELVNKILKNAKKNKAKKTENHDDHDSEMFPEGIQMKKKTDAEKDKKKSEPKPNPEAVPSED
ncbi:translocation/assembly module TamB domain-containing protein [Flavobacterium sedimenticola]|uniref:Translocation/assembly module TamB domain-containing protein n=1 Tax=Flavobacterium sedimenticola TaxID=3043286 RepID=A0ABT6XPV9_9FLAO|nr:translocation/assembly module TamB domain-containing protein [Flavobacterium sedimenticola]MDI9257124.1 translocation/assembly module TamB domain-containing protein [Flavobacterium sedimenticola]